MSVDLRRALSVSTAARALRPKNWDGKRMCHHHPTRLYPTRKWSDWAEAGLFDGMSTLDESESPTRYPFGSASSRRCPSGLPSTTVVCMPWLPLPSRGMAHVLLAPFLLFSYHAKVLPNHLELFPFRPGDQATRRPGDLIYQNRLISLSACVALLGSGFGHHPQGSEKLLCSPHRVRSR